MFAPLPMKRTLLAILLGLVAVTGLVVGYRAYKQAADRALAEQRAAVQLAQIKEHEAELARRTAAIREARRMAEARALEEVARQERQREEEQAAQAALAAAQAELARLAAESERLLAERNLTTADAARLAAERARAAADADAARLAALQHLRELESRRAQADRETARLAALLRQQELELEAQRLALERERQAYEVGGYLVRDFSSLYILKPLPAGPPKPNPTP